MHTLTATEVNKIKPSDKPRKLSDRPAWKNGALNSDHVTV